MTLLQYILFNPLTKDRVEFLKGRYAIVVCEDDGESSHTGIIEPLSMGKTQVGNEVVMNETVTQIILDPMR